MKTKSILQLIDKLKNIEYSFFSGFAIHVYTNGKRDFADIDTLMLYDNLKKFSERVNQPFKYREIKKGDFETEDYFMDFKIGSQLIEVVCPSNTKDAKNCKLILDNKVKKKFLGRNIYLMPIEGIIAHKAKLNREKDIKDLNLLSQFFKKKDLDMNLLKKMAASHKVSYEEVIKKIEDLGF
jgi:predicted nucleotidyltransferase